MVAASIRTRRDPRRQDVRHRRERRQGFRLATFVDPHPPALDPLLPVRQVLERHVFSIGEVHGHEAGSEAVLAVPGDGGADRRPLDARGGVGGVRTERVDRLVQSVGDASGVWQDDVRREHRGQAGDQIRLRTGGRERAIRGQQLGHDGFWGRLSLRGSDRGADNNETQQSIEYGVHNDEFAAVLERYRVPLSSTAISRVHSR